MTGASGEDTTLASWTHARRRDALWKPSRKFSRKQAPSRSLRRIERNLEPSAALATSPCWAARMGMRAAKSGTIFWSTEWRGHAWRCGRRWIRWDPYARDIGWTRPPARCCPLWISETLWPTESKELSRLCASPCITFIERCARVDNALKCNLRKGNLRKVLFAIVEDYTRGSG